MRPLFSDAALNAVADHMIERAMPEMRRRLNEMSSRPGLVFLVAEPAVVRDGAPPHVLERLAELGSDDVFVDVLPGRNVLAGLSSSVPHDVMAKLEEEIPAPVPPRHERVVVLHADGVSVDSIVIEGA